MNLNQLASKYISSAEHVFGNIEVPEMSSTLDSLAVSRVLDLAKAYMEDAKYYREKKKFKVSVTSIAYCEGLLDALRLLGIVKFEWPARKEKPNRNGE